MILQPVLHPVLLVLLLAAPAALVIRALIKGPKAGPGTPGRPIWALRLGMIVVVFAMLLRPGIPGGTSQTLATDTDIVIVVDTTASIIAEDWDGDKPRLTGVRADVQSIVSEYPGARFSLISFDAAAQLRLPGGRIARGAGLPIHAGRLGGEVHRGLLHAGHLAQRALHPRHAAGTGHAANAQVLGLGGFHGRWRCGQRGSGEGGGVRCRHHGCTVHPDMMARSSPCSTAAPVAATRGLV